MHHALKDFLFALALSLEEAQTWLQISGATYHTLVLYMTLAAIVITNIECRYDQAKLNDRWLAARLEGVGQSTLAAVLTILMESHKDSSTALCAGTLTTKTLDLPVGVNFIVL